MDLTHGRGLLLMRELVDHVEYRKSGAEVVLFKTWGPIPEADDPLADADDDDDDG